MSHVDEGRFHAFLDGELDDRGARRLEAHVLECEACAERLDEAARLRALASDLVGAATVPRGDRPAWEELTARAVRPGSAKPGPDTSAALSDPGAVAGAEGPGHRTSPRRRAADEATDTPSPAGWWQRRGRMLAWAATLVLAFTLGWEASRQDPGTVAIPPAPRQAEVADDRPPAFRDAPEREAAATDEGQPRVRTESPETPEEGAAEQGLRGGPEGAISGPAPATAAEEDAALPAGLEAAGAAESRRTSGEAKALTAGDAPAPEPATAPPAPRTETPTEAADPATMEESAAPAPRAADIGAPALLDAGAARAQSVPAFREISLDEAVGWLGRPPLELRSAELQSASLGPAGDLGGALAGRPVLRLRYRDPDAGADVVVLQQVLLPDEVTIVAPEGLAAAARPGDDGRARAGAREPAALRQPAAADIAAAATGTLTVDPDGTRRLSWIHPAGYRVVMAAAVDEATLRDLAARLR